MSANEDLLNFNHPNNKQELVMSNSNQGKNGYLIPSQQLINSKDILLIQNETKKPTNKKREKLIKEQAVLNEFYPLFSTEELTSENFSSKFSNDRKSRKNQRWTKEEDELLIALVEEFDGKCWKKISSFIKDRTPIQCLHRWTKILKPGLVKGPWTAEEDKLLINWVKQNGSNEFFRCNDVIPGRNSKQCRERWFNVLNPKVFKGDWMLSEDYLVFKLYINFGGKWIKFVPFFNNMRAENSIKNRFYSTIRRFNTILKKNNEHSEINEEQKIQLIFNNLKLRVMKEYNLHSEEELQKFEYIDLGFVDRLEDKDPKNKYIDKDDLMKLATEINNSKGKFYKSGKSKATTVIKSADNDETSIVKNQNNKNHNISLKSVVDTRNNFNLNQRLQEKISSNNGFCIDFYNKYVKDPKEVDYSLSVKDSIASKMFSSNIDSHESLTEPNNNFMDYYNDSAFNQLQHNKNMILDNDFVSNALLNNPNLMNDYLYSNSNKAFNNLTLDDLEKKIMSFCGNPNFSIEEDWNANLKNKIQSAFDDVDRELNNNNHQVGSYPLRFHENYVSESFNQENSNINTNTNININTNNNKQFLEKIGNKKNNKQINFDNQITQNKLKQKDFEEKTKTSYTIASTKEHTEKDYENDINLERLRQPPQDIDALMRQLDELEELVRMTKEQINYNCSQNTFNKNQEQMKIDDEDSNSLNEENCFTILPRRINKKN